MDAKFVAQEGDVAWGFFSFNEDHKAHECRKAHPVLVLEDKGYGCIVAYGTSKVPSSPLPTEWVLSDEEARMIGLNRATVFVLTRREMTTTHLNDRNAWSWAGGQFPVKGNVSALSREAKVRLFKACKEAGLV